MYIRKKQESYYPNSLFDGKINFVIILHTNGEDPSCEIPNLIDEKLFGKMSHTYLQVTVSSSINRNKIWNGSILNLYFGTENYAKRGL